MCVLTQCLRAPSGPSGTIRYDAAARFRRLLTNRLGTLAMRTRWITTLTLASGLWFAGLPSYPASPTNPPNILWIVGENFDLDFGCYGAQNVSTPHIDGLANEGVRYTRVFSTSPVCAPSRSAFMTGMYQTTTDTHHMRSHRDDGFRLPDGVRAITHRLRDAGYFTANIKTIGDRQVGTGKLDLNFTEEGPIYQSQDWAALKPNEPFFAQINLPEAEYDIYDRRSAEKKRVKWVGEEWHPRIATPANVDPPPYYPDHPITRREWARYLNSVSGADVRVGWILEQLEEDGLSDDTVVIFFADNGRLEARGIHWCWDSGLHVPLIIRWPVGQQLPPELTGGDVRDELISLIDLTATTLWMAGVEVPVVMQGRRFLGDDQTPQRDFVFSARDRIDETEIRLRSVRGKRYHYVRNFTPGTGFATLNRYKEKCFLVKPLMRKLHAEDKLTGPQLELMQPFPEEMLFDLTVDPHETRNLADSEDEAHRAALMRLRAALDTWMIETGDRGHLAEPPETVAPFEKEMHDWFGTPEWVNE